MDNNLKNRELISQMYKEHAEDVKRYLLSYTHDLMKAEDMLHDLFIKVMHLDLIAPETTRSLLLTMARRMMIDDARHQAFIRKQTEHLIHSAERLEQSSCAMIEATTLMQMEQKRLLQMPEKRANVYRLYRQEGMTTDQIAQQLNLSKRTVESHIYHSTQEMRSYMKKVM